ncbi:MAG TPA: M28 family peptidase [Solirubrobacteraceae bacterium]|jgi:hypothetical protein
MKRALLLSTLLMCGCGGGERVTEVVVRRGGDPVAHLRALQRIADRSDGTRAAGTIGDERTIDYIERTLRAAGWRVERRPVPYPYFERRGTPVLGPLKPGREVRLAEYSGSGRLRGRVVRVRGNGCRVSDFAALPRGAIVLVDRGVCFFRVKARNAARAGVGALVIRDVYGTTPVSATLIRPGVGIPVLIVTAPAARRIAGRAVRLKVDAVSEQRTTENVIAESPGRPKGRWVIAGAHHDSVSAGPGINDDGSGVAALLAIAERRRDVPGLRFGFWAAEELALYGSRAYVRSLSGAGRGDVAAYVNLDMLASPNARLEVYDRDDRVESVLREAIPGPEGEIGLKGASDHAPFEKAGIPIGGIFTGAADRGRRPGPADRCYHRACDTFRHIDTDLARRMTDAAQRALLELAR